MSVTFIRVTTHLDNIYEGENFQNTGNSYFYGPGCSYFINGNNVDYYDPPEEGGAVALTEGHLLVTAYNDNRPASWANYGTSLNFDASVIYAPVSDENKNRNITISFTYQPVISTPEPTPTPTPTPAPTITYIRPYIGNKKVSTMYVGNKRIKEAYVGNKRVYGNTIGYLTPTTQSLTVDFAIVAYNYGGNMSIRNHGQVSATIETETLTIPAKQFGSDAASSQKLANLTNFSGHYYTIIGSKNISILQNQTTIKFANTPTSGNTFGFYWDSVGSSSSVHNLDTSTLKYLCINGDVTSLMSNEWSNLINVSNGTIKNSNVQLSGQKEITINSLKITIVLYIGVNAGWDKK